MEGYNIYRSMTAEQTSLDLIGQKLQSDCINLGILYSTFAAFF